MRGARRSERGEITRIPSSCRLSFNSKYAVYDHPVFFRIKKVQVESIYSYRHCGFSYGTGFVIAGKPLLPERLRKGESLCAELISGSIKRNIKVSEMNGLKSIFILLDEAIQISYIFVDI